MLRLVRAAERYNEKETCEKILVLRKRGAIDDREAYHYAGQLLGGHVRNADQFFHVKVKHVKTALDAVNATQAWHTDYHSALEALRYADVRCHANQQAVQYLKDLAALTVNGINTHTMTFRDICEKGAKTLKQIYLETFPEKETEASKIKI